MIRIASFKFRSRSRLRVSPDEPASSTVPPLRQAAVPFARSYNPSQRKAEMTQRILFMLFPMILILAFAAAAAKADALVGDPRKCSPSTGQTTPKPADCAKAAAKVTLLTYMRAHRGKYWSNPISCTQTSPTSLLKWRCSFQSGTAVVWFRPLSTGWSRVVTVTMNP